MAPIHRSTDRLVLAAERIDTYYDNMLYDGMPMSDAHDVERQREIAHQNLAEETIRQAIAFTPQR